MIQEYLNAQFIVTTSDENFDKLMQASSNIADKLKEDRTKLSSYTLAVLDPQISADDPIIIEVRDTIIGGWKTFMTSSKDTALTTIRAVILEALATIAQDERAAHTIWYAGRNVLKYYKLGREKEILTDFLLRIGNRIEKTVVETWSFGPDKKIGIPEIDSSVISKVDLEPHFLAATIAKGTGSGENTSTINAGDHAWATFFSARISKGIQDVMNKAFRKQATEFKNNQQQFFQKVSYLQMRTQLLWWKEANYSNSLNLGYDTLDNGTLPFLIANDYAIFVPALYPVSVDYFLKIAFNALTGDNKQEKKIIDIIILIDQHKTVLRTILPTPALATGRTSLLHFLNCVIHDLLTPAQLQQFVGVNPESSLTAADLTVWLFHDLTSLKQLN